MNRRNKPVTVRIGITWKVFARHRETMSFIRRLVNKRESSDKNMHESEEYTCHRKRSLFVGRLVNKRESSDKNLHESEEHIYRSKNKCCLESFCKA